MKIVMTVGVFDMLHIGHIYTLKESKNLGDKLIVGIQTDESVKKQKGNFPIMSIDERIDIINMLNIVDEIFVYSDLDQTKNLKKYKVNIFTQGPDYLKQSDRTLMLRYMKDHDISFEVIEKINNISSTEIKERVLSQNRKNA